MKSPSQRQPTPPPQTGKGRAPAIAGMPIGNKSGLEALDSRKAKHLRPAKLSKQGPSNPKGKTTTLPHTKKRRKGELKRLPKPPGGMGSGLIAGAYQSSGGPPALSQGKSYSGGATKPGINKPRNAQKKF